MVKIYLGELYRFGYTLTYVGESEEEVKKAIMKEYVKAYKDQNGGRHPSREVDYRYGDKSTYYANAKEDIEIRELEMGKGAKVEWM